MKSLKRPALCLTQNGDKTHRGIQVLKQTATNADNNICKHKKITL